jgi:hypothetical protein
VKTIVTVLAAVLVIVIYLSASVSVALTTGPVPSVTPFTYLVYYGLLGTAIMMIVVAWLSAGGMTK